MLEPTSTMTYKAVLHITQSPRCQDHTKLFETILTYIADYLESRFCITIESSRFAAGHSNKFDQDGCLVRAALLYAERGAQELIRWAVCVRCRDSLNKRRTWINHIGLEQQSDGSFTLYFAECCAVHQAGSFSPPKTPVSAPPVLLKMLMGCRSLCCLSGSEPLVGTPWRLVETGIRDFLSILYDAQRTIPVVLITCPDLVDPKLLATKTLGNMSIYCMDDYKTHSILCRELSPELRFPWGAIKIYMPFGCNRTFHSTIPYQDAVEMGGVGVADALYRAFCTCLTGDERRAFVSLDSIYEALKQRSSDKLKAQATTLSEECQQLRAANEQLSDERNQLSAEITRSREQFDDAQTYEDLLAEATQEIAQMKQGLSLLTERLYANPREDVSAEGLACDELRDLAVALRTFQTLSLNRHG